MIDAKTAREKTAMHDDFRNYMDKIEGAVVNGVKVCRLHAGQISGIFIMEISELVGR